MNRRDFLTGLLASAAVAPIAAKLSPMVLRTAVEVHKVYGASPGMLVASIGLKNQPSALLPGCITYVDDPRRLFI